jgi:ribosomal protein L16 Arg81 hydroxylase
MAIAELLGEIPPAHFYQQYFLKLPFAYAAGCAHLLSLATRNRFLDVLSLPGADVVATTTTHAQRCSTPINENQLGLLLQAGATIGVRHAQRQDAKLAELAAGFAKDCNAVVDIHVYMTPASANGFGWHYDAEDVFILQTCGEKSWDLRKNTVNPWPLIETLPEDMEYEKEIMPLLSCKLAPGDWLYIPAGYWHRTRALTESLSLSVGIATRSGIDVLDFARGRLLNSLRWRQRIMPVIPASSTADSDQALAAQLSELAQDLAALLASPTIAHEFVEYCRMQACHRSS